MRLTTDWSCLINATSAREQVKREDNGSRNREALAINIECAIDNPKPRVKRGKSVDDTSINIAVRAQNVRVAHDVARMTFGPRLVRADGTALYKCQVKR